MIERGRWSKKKVHVDKRKCPLCNVVENEFHVLIECPRFINERINCLPDSLKLNPCQFEFDKYFRSKDENVLKKLGILCLRVQKEYVTYV